MNITKLGFSCALVASVLATTTAANAFCSDNWADVTILCPKPVPWRGTKILTPTSQKMATVGVPGTYKNYGNGYDVKVYLGHHGTGYQKFFWQEE